MKRFKVSLQPASGRGIQRRRPIIGVFLPARRRPSGLVVSGVCLCVCVCALFLSARYLKNGFMNHHQIRRVGAGGEPLEEV